MAKLPGGDDESKGESFQLRIYEFSVEEAFADVVNWYLDSSSLLDQHRTDCMLGHREISEKFLPRQWLCQNRSMSEVNLKLLEGPFAFVGPGKLLAAAESVEEKEAFFS